MRALQRKFCLLLAIWVLNLSIDAPDLVRALEGEAVAAAATGTNEVESVSEWLVEHLLGQAEAVPELDEASDAPDDRRSVDQALGSARWRGFATAAPGAHAAPVLADLRSPRGGLEPPPPRLG